MPRYRFLVLSLAILTSAACASPGKPSGPAPNPLPALFYSKDGSIYVSDPAGTPGRKLTDGPADTEPAPSPDGKRVAFVHKATRDDRGGELWVLGLAAGSASTPHRLVDPAALVPKFEGEAPGQSGVGSPHWSPAGDRIAFLKTGEGGGFLLTAVADTGAVQAPPQPLFARESYAWAPDGQRIAWTGGRSDVRQVDVNVLTIGGESTPVVSGTNAFAVAYAEDGRSILFANGDATGSLFNAIPFTLREGGIYSIDPPSGPQPVFTGGGSYTDVAALPSGVVAFSEWNPDSKTKSIRVTGGEGKSTRTVADTPGEAPGPAWTRDTVAYVGTAAERPLLIKTSEEDAQQVDSGVDAFAWGR